MLGLEVAQELDDVHEDRPRGSRQDGAAQPAPPASDASPAKVIEVVAFVRDMFHAGLASDVIRDFLPCARDEHPRGDCAELLARVRQVRDELARQEHHIAERRRPLDTYLADGYEARPVSPLPARTETVR
ncbi:hypothetical protein ABZ646_10225 [Streptomyces sp. NPDC007162]|uniref:hypothetical protein n=1 Tax=Streptomyces sp. NPDC007162 TaxID=3156917 RepID=UPI003405E4A4